MGTVTDEGSAYRSNSVGPNRLLKDGGVYKDFIKYPKIIVEALLMITYSFPVDLQGLRDHLLCLSGGCIILRNLLIICLMYIGLAGACPEPSVKRASGYIIPDIHPCNFRVNLAERGIQELHFEKVYDELRELNVSNNKIQYILTGVFHGMALYHLDLSRNRLIVIGTNSFNGSSVSWIDLSRNQIEIIFEGAFEGLQGSLTHLNLAYNRLSKLKKGAISNLQSVTYLDVSYNCLVYIERDAFKGMDRLLVLYLQGNQLTVVSGWLPSVGGLLDLSGNSLTTTEGLPQSANISLNVSSNQFTCSVETNEFSEWCSQTENCHGLNDLKDICYDDVDSDTSKGESPLTTDQNGGNGVNRPHACGVLTVVVSVLLGFYFAFPN